MISTDVVIIGGGATGTGILRDLSMRGIGAILIEQGWLANGTSSRFHGLLHSGARYAVKDVESARECITENNILRNIGKQCVELTEGIFALTEDDNNAYVETWLNSCKTAGIKTEEIELDDLYNRVPNISRKVRRAFTVPDSGVDGFRLVWHNVESAKHYGGVFKTYCKVTKINTISGAVKGVEVINLINGEQFQIACNYVVNSAGSWCGEIASLAGLDVPISPDRGTLLVFNHRITSRVVNRLHESADGDIFVPHGSVTILGTTSAEAKSPDDNKPSTTEVIKLLEIGSNLFPDIYNYRILRAFAGTRPLFAKHGEGRGATRGFVIIDHADEGLAGFASIFGGKLTTYRLMAEKLSDLVCKRLGVNIKCRTADEPMIPDIDKKTLIRAERYFSKEALSIVADRIGNGLDDMLHNIENDKRSSEIICECEMVSLAEVKFVAKDPETHYLNVVRLRTRLGMGTCQGTFCSLRAISALSDGGSSIKKPTANIISFLQERWGGLRVALWGSQSKEAELARAIYISTLNINGGNDEI